MAEIFNDNFETGDLSAWTANTDVSVETGIAGMEGDYCAELSLDTSKLTFIPIAAQDEIYVAFDFIPINATGAYGPLLLFRAAAGAPDYATALGMLYAQGTGVTPIQIKLEAWGAYFAAPGELASHDVFLDAGTKYHVEVRYKPHKIDGIFQVKLDGVLVIDVTGVATCPAGVTVTDVVQVILGAGSSDSMYFYADRVNMDDAAWPDMYEPPAAEYAADGFLSLCGAGVSGGDENATTTDYAADGCLNIVGQGAVEFSPSATELAASGALILGGSCGLESRPPSAYVADGHIELSGTCRFVSTSPYVPPISLITEYAADGSLIFSGLCTLDNVLQAVEAFIASGFYLIGGKSALGIVRPASLPIDAYVAAGCYEIGSPYSIVRGPVYAYAADTKLGPPLEITSRAKAGFIYPQTNEMVADGGYILESPDIPFDGVFETLVLTGARGEVSFYSNFKFNSYAKYGGKYYGATQDGIFLLEGEDDDGAQIHSGAQIGPANFGTDREKRLRLIRCGGECDGAQVRVSNDDGKLDQFSVLRGRANISRAVQGRELTVEIVDFKSLTHLEIIPLVLAKR